MKISKCELVDMSACTSGLKRFIKQTGGSSEPVDVTSLIGGENTTSDLLWLAGKTLSKEKIVKFACKCALISIDLIKPHCSESDFKLITNSLNDPAARAYVDAARAYAAVDAAVDAAYAATYAAYAAVDAAYATVDAAYAAVDAAYAAVDAAYAADAAARAAVDAEISNLLIDLFTE
ncbi:conserved hypothetical protein [Vibrio phage 489E54-1]|nr:conserved hypothetical protein [Vibrio phage 489E54-1]